MLKPIMFAALVAAVPTLHAAEAIVNGSFEADGAETYAPAGWGVVESAAIGGVVVTDQTLTPATGLAIAAPSSGQFQAVIETFQPGAFTLSQSFATAPVISALLSFDLGMYDPQLLGSVIDGAGLDETTGGSFADNQHFRVDLLGASAGALDTGAGVLRNLFIGGADGSNASSFGSYSFDLGADLAAGGTYALRFAAVGNLGQQAFTIDNVSLDVTPVPEPSTYAMLIAGLGLLCAVSRRRSRS